MSFLSHGAKLMIYMVVAILMQKYKRFKSYFVKISESLNPDVFINILNSNSTLIDNKYPLFVECD